MDLAQESIRNTMKEISNWFERSTKKSKKEIELGRIREYQTWMILWSSSLWYHVEIKNASSKKVQQWQKACKDVKTCRERENEHSELWENDFVSIKITDSVSLYSRNRATKWPSEAIQLANTNMTSGLTN